MSFAAFELHIRHRSVVFYVVQWLSASTASDFCTLLLLTLCVRTVCVKPEQKNAKLNLTWLNGLLTIGEHQNFPEEGNFIVGEASVAFVWCLTAIHYLWFLASCGNTVRGSLVPRPIQKIGEKGLVSTVWEFRIIQ